MRLKYLAAGLLSLCAASVWADARQNIAQSMERLQFPVPISAVSESPVEGLHQVQLENGKVIYATADGRHLIQGVLLLVSDDGVRNLTAEVEAEQAKQVLAALPGEQLVVFARDQAMTNAKQGKRVSAASCEDPVAEQYSLGSRLGVQGTPAIFFANGRLLPGYKPAQQLAAEAIANK